VTKPPLKWQERLLGVQHALTSGAAGKPHSIVTVHVTNPDLPPLMEAFPAAFEGDTSHTTDTEPSTLRVRKFAIEPGLKVWAGAVRETAKEARVDTKDLWVLISCGGRGTPLDVSTRIREDVLCLRMTQQLEGQLTAYARLEDFLTLVQDADVRQVAILNDMISFVTGGVRQEFPYYKTVRDNIARPVSPPRDGFTEVRHLGTALNEAMKWVADSVDTMGRENVRVLPADDATGAVEIYALRPEAGYRRTLKAWDLKRHLTLRPSWVMKQPKILGAHLGVRVSGLTFAWLMSASGIIQGINMPNTSWCENFSEFLEGKDGRIEFTYDQANAFRRALLQMAPNSYQFGASGISLTSLGSSLQIQGKDKTVEVECMGDPSHEIIVNPDMLADALAMRNVRFLEFDKEDPDQYVRLSGPDVAISIAPLGDKAEVPRSD
jgi:hypothetical protein